MNKKSTYYVDNDKLYAAIVKWNQTKELNPDTPLNNEIGQAILHIAQNLARRWNFSGYTSMWKELMIGDAIEVAIKCVKNFDYHTYHNPHAYLSQVCFRAFQNRIKMERRETAGRYKYFVEEVYDSDCADMSTMVDVDFYQDMITKIADYENGIKKKTHDKHEHCDDVEDIPLSGLGLIYGKDF